MEFIKKVFRKKKKDNNVSTDDVIDALYQIAQMSRNENKNAVMLKTTAGFLTALYSLMPESMENLDSEVLDDAIKGPKNLKSAYYFLKDCKEACLMLKDQYILESDRSLKHASYIVNNVIKVAMNYPSFKVFMLYIKKNGMQNYLAPDKLNMTLLSKEVGRMLSISDKKAMGYIKIFIDTIIKRIKLCERHINPGYIKSVESFHSPDSTDGIDPIIKRTAKPVKPEFPGLTSAPPGLVNRRTVGSAPKKTTNQ